MISSVKQNAIVDLCALCAFLPSLVSGLVLLVLLPSGGYQGGRNPLYGEAVLGIARSDWVVLHNASSMVFAALVLLHILLHWRYFRNIPRCFRNRAAEHCEAGPDRPDSGR
ncbi:MAG: DUF4405 domain-containing protein [Methanomicrobiales archaeon]|nr:DUF4405 domain-containing protein [Methanomicrobiales archaeon]